MKSSRRKERQQRRRTETPAVPQSSAFSWQPIVVAVLLGAAVIAVYWPALHGDFIWDDEVLVSGSAIVKAANGLYRIWLTTEPIDYWPVTNTSFWLEWRLWGSSPIGYHVTNAALHFINAMLIWSILK